MSPQTSTATQQYAHDILRRSREPMEPRDYEVDWNDAPLRHKVFQGVRRVPLPEGSGTSRVWDELERCLRGSYAPLTRRTRITPNAGVEHMQTIGGAIYGRGSASGGGMYPVELYLVVGARTGIPAGIYHYSSAHHMLDVLLPGDFRDRVRQSLRPPVGGRRPELPELYVLAAVNFWKNSFKYNSFCYHVVTTDIGTLFGAWRAVSEEPVECRLWFDERDLDELLGLDPDEESVFAVVPFGAGTAGGAGPAAPADPGGDRTAPEPARPHARVRVPWVQRSRRTQTFPANRAVQRDMLDDDASTPDRTPGLVEPSGFPGAATLPDARPLDRRRLTAATRARHSSFGLFTGAGGISTQQLADALAFAGAERLIPLAGDTPAATDMLRLSVFANHVRGLPAGAYHVAPGTPWTLHEVPGPPIHPFLQYTYYLTNYNLEQAAAVVAISGRPETVIEQLGPRGYRLLNAEVGAMAQRLYLAGSAAGLGCGAVFGFDNVAIRERLGLAGTDEWPLLLVMIGPERPGPAQFRYVLPTGAALATEGGDR